MSMIITETKLEIVVQPSGAKPGIVLMSINGEPQALTVADTFNLIEALQEAYNSAKFRVTNAQK